MFDIRKMQETAIYEAVKAESDADTAGEVAYGKGGSARTESNPDWVQSTMRRLERKFDGETVKKIRRSCQCGYGMEEKLALLRDLAAHAESLEELADSERAKAAGLFCRDGALYLQFGFCPCPMLAEVDKLEKNTWCQCTTGYSKVLFEQAFACSADVELLESVKMGDGRCLMRITLHSPVWQA